MTPRKSARDALRDRGRAVAGASSAPAEVRTDGEATPPPATPATPRTRPIKSTVELQPVEHRALKAWCTATADELGLPLVASSEVLRVLWQLMQADPVLAARVRTELARSGGSRRR